MKRILLTFIILCFVSCAGDQSKKGISGTAKGVEDGTKLFVSAMGENNSLVPIDTAVVTAGKFTLDLPSTETQTLNMLQLEGTRGNLIFIGGDESLSFELFKDSLRTSEISGGKHNELLSKYMGHIRGLAKEYGNLRNQFRDPANLQNPAKIQELREKQETIMQESTEFRKALIQENPSSLVSVMALSDMMNMQVMSTAEIRELYDSLSEEVKNSVLGKRLGKSLEESSATEIGAMAPSFSAPTPDGGTLSLEEAMGKVTLIDFWASWCKPCRIENPNIVRVYEKYHDKGLNIIGVSLDKSKEKWVQAIEADNLSWQHVSHLNSWMEPIAKKYNVRSIPKAFLLDENGVIVAKDLRGKELEAKVAELLGE